MKIIEIAFFAYAVSDIKKARAFYGGVLATVKAKNISVIIEPPNFSSCPMIVIADPDGNRLTLHKRNKE